MRVYNAPLCAEAHKLLGVNWWTDDNEESSEVQARRAE